MTRLSLRGAGATLPLALALLGAQAGLGGPLSGVPPESQSATPWAWPALAGAALAVPGEPLELTGAAGAQEGLAGVRALIGEGALVRAVVAAEALPEDLDGLTARVESRYWAGDLAGAMAAARSALESHPRDPQLLLLASELSTQLLLPVEGLRLAELLQEEAKQLSGELGSFYSGRSRALRAEAEQALAWQEWVQGAESRTRALALGVVVLVMGATAVLALKGSSRGPAARS
ncbi:MAG: hypothetical protein ISQ08_01690 [Planctomycetes bacterium]|nr:hypothetical protein [Planctomycetota bacterium]